MSLQAVPRVERLSLDAFREQYARPGVPVVITHALNWPALRLWTHEWFKCKYGAIDVQLSVNPTHTRKVVTMPLGAYIDRILESNRIEGGLYLDQFPLDRLPGLTADFSVPEYCDPQRDISPHLWLGPGTTVLSFHKDNHNPLVQLNNIFVQIHGRKRFILASPENDSMMYPRPPEVGAYWHSRVDPESPDLDQFPLFAHVKLLQATVGPGDIVFIPRNYWHHVRALERSISMSFWWHPFRFMEIVTLLLTPDVPHLEALRSHGRLSVTYADIAEIGGPSQIETAFGEFSDLTLLRKLCTRLLPHTDTKARIVLESALHKRLASYS